MRAFYRAGPRGRLTEAVQAMTETELKFQIPRTMQALVHRAVATTWPRRRLGASRCGATTPCCRR
jgi:hypothetical protein